MLRVDTRLSRVGGELSSCPSGGSLRCVGEISPGLWLHGSAVPTKVAISVSLLMENRGTVTQEHLKLILSLWISEWAGLKGWKGTSLAEDTGFPLSPLLSLSLCPSLLSLWLSLLPVLAGAPAVGGAGFPGIVGQLFLLCLLPLAQSFALMTALQQDYWGADDSAIWMPTPTARRSLCPLHLLS